MIKLKPLVQYIQKLSITNQLYQACCKDNVDELKTLYKQNSSFYQGEMLGNILTEGGISLINGAAFKNAINCIRYMLEQGVDLNKADKFNNYPIVHSFRHKNAEIFMLLMEHGADISNSCIFARGLKYSPNLISEYIKSHTIDFMISPENIIELIKYAIDHNDRSLFLFLLDQKTIRFDNELFHKAVRKNRIYFVRKMIETGTDINFVIDNKTPLNEAFKNANIEIAKLLIDNGGTSSIKDNPEHQPILYAILHNHSDLLKCLVENGYNLNVYLTINDTTEPPIITVIKNKRFDMLDYFFDDYINLNLRDNIGNTALAYLINNAEYDAAKLLIEKGADIYHLNKNDENALHLHGQTLRFNEDFIYYLLNKCIDINLYDSNEETGLTYLLKNGSVQLAKVFIDRGANIYHLNKNDENALHLYCRLKWQDVDFIDYLFNMRMDVNNRDKDGTTALFYVESPEIINYLIMRGMNINIFNHAGRSALHHAVMQRYGIAAIKALVENGIKLNINDTTNSSALAYAFKLPSLEIADYLIEKDAKITGIMINNKPLAIYLAKRDEEGAHYKILAKLVKKGLNINQQDNEGSTALSIMLKLNDIETATAYIKLGANYKIIRMGNESLMVWAIKQGLFNLAIAIINRGINSTDTNATNLLHIAMENPNEELIKLLIFVGANPFAKNHEQKTAFELISGTPKEQEIINWINKTKIESSSTLFRKFSIYNHTNTMNPSSLSYSDCDVIASKIARIEPSSV